MKKHLALAALLAFASAAQAATLNWTINQVKVNDTLFTGGTAFLFITQQSGDFGAGTTTMEDVESFIKKGATPVTQVINEETGETKIVGLKSGNTVIDVAAVGSPKNGMVTGGTGYYGQFTDGDSLSAFAVIFDDIYGSAKNYITTSVQSVAWTSSLGVKALPFGSQANATWKAVPEPSVALMGLLGLGMLLKRRKA